MGQIFFYKKKKTFLAINELAKFASQPKQKVWYVAPSYRQAKQIVWNELKERLIKHKWVKKINHSDLTITLKNNSHITLRGSDNENSLRGVGLHFLVMDEFADTSKETWYIFKRSRGNSRWIIKF